MNKIWRLILVYWPWRYALKGVALAYDSSAQCMVFKPCWEADETTSLRERIQFRRWWYQAEDIIRDELKESSHARSRGLFETSTVIQSKFEDTQRVIGINLAKIKDKDFNTDWSMPSKDDTAKKDMG